MNNKINLSSIDDVKVFVEIANTFNCDIDLVSDRYIVNAKSIMGIFSLDLTKPIEIKVSDESQTDEFLSRVSAYIVK